MRTIKFRAWDELNQEMVYEKTGIFSGGKSSWEILKLYENVMQFTGLHDNNGKELYEGDIISDMEDETMVLPVIFDNEYSQFAVDVSYHNDGSSIDDIPTCYEKGFEIIGNVFENQDLVKL